MGEESSFFAEDFSENTLFYVNDVEPPKRETKKEENHFEILSIDNIAEDVSEIMYKVQTFLALPTTMSAIRALLTHYKWDYQRLIGEYYEYENDPAAFFEQAHVTNPFDLEMPKTATDSEDCKICYSEVSTDELYSLNCGHKYCNDCWNSYLTTKIVDEGLDQMISCLDPECGFMVDDENIIMMVRDPDVISKYQRAMTNSFVQHNKAMRWCPFPGCCFAAKKKNSAAKSLCQCKCGHEFCFECCDYWHEPVTCIRLKQWKNSDDSETLEWMAKHAKNCPSCEAVIEKNGGCNHMTCRNCRHEFCWLCMGNWTGHRACNRFNETGFVGPRELARFNHFRDRYVNQLESLRLEGIFHRNIDSKIDELKESCSMTNNQVRFLRDAVKVLHVTRRTLTYTFVFAYFLQKNNQVEIFEDNQSNLESAVERLSGLLEKEINAENIVDLKQNILDSYKFCEGRCKVLMDHIREAETQKLWVMNA